MAVQRSHSKARPAVARADELPAGVAAPVAAPARPVQRDRSGKLASSEAAKALGRLGGKAKAANDAKKWGRTLGLGGLLAALEADKHLAPFVAEAERWLRAKTEELARDVGGGVVGAGVVSVLRTAAWQRAFGEFLFECGATGAFAWNRTPGDKAAADIQPRTDLVLVASRLGDASRQNLLAAHELCAREAQARSKAPAAPTDVWEQARRVVAERIAAREAAPLPALDAPAAVDAAPAPEDFVRSDRPMVSEEISGPADHRLLKQDGPVGGGCFEPEPDARSWLPAPLRAWASAFEDMRGLHAADTAAFKAAALPRAEAMVRTKRAPEEMVHAVRAWLEES